MDIQRLENQCVSIGNGKRYGNYLRYGGGYGYACYNGCICDTDSYAGGNRDSCKQPG